MSCNVCGSTNIEYGKDTARCKDCGYTWFTGKQMTGKFMFTLIITFVFISLMSLACGWGGNRSAPARAALPTLTPTPEAEAREGFSAGEAWQLVAAEEWAADARPGNRISCIGGLSSDGYCKEWWGTMGSATRGEVAGFQVRSYMEPVVVIQGPGQDPSILRNAFPLEELLDSPDIAAIARQWLAQQGKETEGVLLHKMGIQAVPATLRECGAGDPEPAEAYYDVEMLPANGRGGGRLCINARSGRVTRNSFD